MAFIFQIVSNMEFPLAILAKYLRRNPLARAGFIFYLLLIHSWTFVLLFFHAHSFETFHADNAASISLAHGPHALMKQQMEKQVPLQPQQVNQVAGE